MGGPNLLLQLFFIFLYKIYSILERNTHKKIPGVKL